MVLVDGAVTFENARHIAVDTSFLVAMAPTLRRGS
jgi:hypothetical protein